MTAEGAVAQHVSTRTGAYHDSVTLLRVSQAAAAARTVRGAGSVPPLPADGAARLDSAASTVRNAASTAV